MFVNAGKFQFIKIESSNGKINPQSLKLRSNFIQNSEIVNLSGIEIETI